MSTERETQPNKLAIALQVRAAMKEHRRGKPIAFQHPPWPALPAVLRESAE